MPASSGSGTPFGTTPVKGGRPETGARAQVHHGTKRSL